MAVQSNQEVKKPANFDLDKALKAVRAVILRNTKWIKEMAAK